MLKFRQESRSSLVLALVVLFCLFLTLPVLAEDGSGDGSGGGHDAPLALAASNPADGASNVAVITQIKLTFNKNVINMSVKDNNVKCFALYNNGQQVPINVIMADDQMQPEYKREVTIAPQQSLQPGSSYTLKISPKMQAKSGSVLEQEVQVSFTTAGKNVTPTTPKDNTGNTVKPTEPANQQTDANKNQAVQNQVTGDDTTADSDKLETSNNQVSAEKDETKPEKDKVNNAETASTDDNQTRTADNDNSLSKPLIVGIVVVAGALILYFFLRRK
ncbi:MAG: Ig-like domain-containing protein [Syntrophomonadaceae bacterium]|nr:Ig-like domain-containing protein [Syntrophomonadaceae bacterium]NLX00925.1 Ig-like domain-containing protein [Syntrophomonadaceae bacterium]